MAGEDSSVDSGRSHSRGEDSPTARRDSGSARKIDSFKRHFVYEFQIPGGYEGGYTDELLVFNRQGQPCLRCKKTQIVKMKVAQRGTHICERCQAAPATLNPQTSQKRIRRRIQQQKPARKRKALRKRRPTRRSRSVPKRSVRLPKSGNRPSCRASQSKSTASESLNIPDPKLT